MCVLYLESVRAYPHIDLAVTTSCFKDLMVVGSWDLCAFASQPLTPALFFFLGRYSMIAIFIALPFQEHA